MIVRTREDHNQTFTVVQLCGCAYVYVSISIGIHNSKNMLGDKNFTCLNQIG